MTNSPKKKSVQGKVPAATVYLVGAGPGDEGLITVKGQQVLSKAQVVVYDALCNPALLDHAPADAEHLYVGKRGGNHTLTQDQINDALVEHAKAGRTVVRLKGGDPYLFGRGGEEVSFLHKHGIPSQVIPGITAGIAVPMMAGIPVTHRKIASTVTFVTGHEDPTKDQTRIDYNALARLINMGGTACFYMGIGRLGSICDALAAGDDGLSLETPAAVVQWGTTPRQRSLRTTLGTAVEDLKASGISSPAIILVGQVAAIDEPGLDFFTSRPLFGQTILVTRTRQQASAFRQQLEALGANVLEAPTIDVVRPDDWTPTDNAIQALNDYDWLILTSVNGVNALVQRMAVLGLDSRHLSCVKIAAIGSAVDEALWDQLRIKPDMVPTQFVAESLAGELIAQNDLAGQRMLLLRADIARPALPKLLAEAGADITELVVYQTQKAQSLPDNVIEALEQGQVDWVTFTSSSTAQNMFDLLGSRQGLLKQTRLASIGPITSQTLQRLNLPIAIEASPSDIAGLTDALVNASALDTSATV